MSKRIPTRQITAWSFSRYATYKQCPLKAKLQFIDKIKEPANDAMKRGMSVHDAAEAYIKGVDKQGVKTSTLPPELTSFKRQFQILRKQYKKSISGMVVEDTWAFTKDWDETQWTDWVGCWVRIKLDCAYHVTDDIMIVVDWKTGRFRSEMGGAYSEQLELYALAGLLLHPHLKEVRPCIAYTDHGVVFPPDDEPIIYTRGDIPKLKKIWSKRTRSMLVDKSFAPRPNDKCHWCFYRRSNSGNGGGQCKY